MSRNTSGPVTQREIARMLGVSQATVSMALRRTGQITPKLEKAILEACRRRGYSLEAQFNARDLRLRRDGKHTKTNVICALVPNSVEILSRSPFNVRIVNGIEREIRKSSDELLLAPGVSISRQFPRVVVRGQVDGLIWMPSEQDLVDMDGFCSVSVVTLFYRVPGADVAAVAEQEAMRAMGEYLARRGHRRVAFVGNVSDLAKARLNGLRAGLAAAGGTVSDQDVHTRRFVMLPEHVLPMVREAMDRWRTLPEPERFTAIAAYNDYMAFTVMRCLQDEYGLRVPRDMSVTGFDGVDSGDGAFPRLTTAAMPLEELGAEAVRMIDWRLQNPGNAHRRVELPVPLAEGESVASVSVRPGHQT